MEQYRVQSLRDRDDGIEDPEEWFGEGLDDEEARVECDSLTLSDGDSVEDWLYRPQLDVEYFLGGAGLGILIVLGLLAALIGTTYVGHDWASRSMSNQLLFESRRSRVWFAKAAALLLTVVLATVAVLALVWLSVWVLRESRDVATSAALWRDAASTQVRGVGLITAMALGSYAVTMWFRSTVGALGLITGVGVVSSIILAALLGDEANRWMVSSNAFAVLENGYEYYDESAASSCSGRGPCSDTFTLSGQAGAIYLAVLLLAVTIPSWLSFQRRDVP